MLAGCSDAVKEEFHPRNCFLQHENPGKFVQFECSSSKLYIVWRVVWAIYHVGAIIATGLLEQYYATTVDNRIKWFIFMTNWAYFVLTITVLLDLGSTLYIHCYRPDIINSKGEPMPWYLKTLWVLSNMTNSIGIQLSLMYWSVLHKPEWGLDGYRILPFLTHGMNTVYIMLNLLVTGLPVRILHFWQPVIFGLTYVVFSIVYTVSGGTNDMGEPHIYSILDWNQNMPTAAGVAAGAIVAAIFIHILVFLVSVVRMLIARTWCRKDVAV